MVLPSFLNQESTLLGSKLVLWSIIGGLTNGLLIAMVFMASRRKPEDEVFALVALFLVSLVLYVVSKVYTQRATAREMEAIARKVRLRVADSVRKAELIDFQRVGASRYYNVLTGELLMIMGASKKLVSAISSAWLALAGVAYVAYLSVAAAVVTGVVMFLGFVQFQRNNRVLEGLLMSASVAEHTFLDRLRDLRDGFSELKLDADKSDDLFENYIVRNALLAEAAKLETEDVLIQNGVFIQTFFYGLLGSVVFVLPFLTELDLTKQGQIVAVLIFILGPIAEVVMATQDAIKAAGAIGNIRKLEADLSQLEPVPREPRDPVQTFGAFEELTLSSVTFSYPDRPDGRRFRLKPANLTVRRGEIIFLVGGNGSGKSTLIHVLSGLYLPHDGEIRVNGALVDEHLVTAYRALFGTVLQDYHLFDRLYGNAHPDIAEADRLLKEFDLYGKTSIRADGTISTLDLSGGQRKRLAMIATRLDDAQIFIFDEWAADQDPEYKRYFYLHLLPQLAAQGKAIIVVSHDDNYFPSDLRHVYRMVDGEIRPYTAPGARDKMALTAPPGGP